MGHAFADRRWPENFPSCTGAGRESDDPVEAKWKSGWAARRRWPRRPAAQAPEDEMTGARQSQEKGNFINFLFQSGATCIYSDRD
jgi:hypothetical protein